MQPHEQKARPRTARALLRRAARLLCLVALAALNNSCGEQPVAKVRTEGDAVEIAKILTEYGFDVRKEETGEGAAVRWSVFLDEGWFGGGEVSQATQVLNYYGLPRPEEQGAPGSDSGGMFPTPSAENAKQLKERERKIEKQLRILPGVARVEVNIVLPEDDDIKINPYKASASVVIRLKEERARFGVEDVKAAVVNSVPDLQPERVGVVMTFEPPPVVPRQDLELRRRNRVILLVGALLVTVLLVLLALMLLRMRRQRDDLKALRDAEVVGALAEAEDGAPEPRLPGTEMPRLETEKTASDAARRQLPAG